MIYDLRSSKENPSISGVIFSWTALPVDADEVDLADGLLAADPAGPDATHVGVRQGVPIGKDKGQVS